MKYTNLLVAALMFIMLASCGAKEEKKEPQDIVNDEVIDIEDNQSYYDSQDNVTDGDAQVNDVTPAEPEPVETPKEEPKEEKPKVEKPKVVKPKPVVKKHQKRYYVVVGSFKEYNNAKKLETYFKAKGYSTWVLPRVDELNRVAIVSYIKEADARVSIKKLRIEHNDMTFWLYRW